MGRIIAIGDVHGCHEEFEELIERLRVDPRTDRVIQLGDLVNRGPDSHRAIRLAEERGIESILGNHELRLLRARREGRDEALKDYDWTTLEQLSDDDWRYLEGLPRFKQAAYIDTVFVHGGFRPDEPWHRQSIDDITEIQVLDAHGRAAKQSDHPEQPPWADHWPGSPFVIYGHTPRSYVLRRRGSIGIDTACVYGGYLTAYVMPDQRFVHVRARQAYAHSKRLPDPVNM